MTKDESGLDEFDTMKCGRVSTGMYCSSISVSDAAFPLKYRLRV